MSDQYGLQTLESMSQADWYNKWTVSKFSKYLKGKMLEIGCGIGNLTIKLSSYGEVCAIDVNKNFLSKRKRIPQQVRVGFGDIEKGKYFFSRRKFNCLVCMNVLEHIEKDSLALSNMNKLLSKEGVLVLLVPIHMFLYNNIDKKLGHFRRYEKDELLSKLKKTGFIIQTTRKLNLLGAIGWFISGTILQDNIVSKKKIRIYNLIAPLCLKMEDLIEPFFGTSLLIIARKK